MSLFRDVVEGKVKVKTIEDKELEKQCKQLRKDIEYAEALAAEAGVDLSDRDRRKMLYAYGQGERVICVHCGRNFKPLTDLHATCVRCLKPHSGSINIVGRIAKDAQQPTVAEVTIEDKVYNGAIEARKGRSQKWLGDILFLSSEGTMYTLPH